MKLVLQQRGIEIECTCDEFQQIYPAISNGKAAIESTEVTPLKSKAIAKEEKSPYRKGSNAEKVLKVMQKHPNKSFTAIDLVGKAPCTERTLHSVLSRLARDGKIKRGERGHYTFFESDLEDAVPITISNHTIPRLDEQPSQHAIEDAKAKASSIRNIQGEGVRTEPSQEMSEKMVKAMWKHVKPLFEIGKPIADSQIMKMLGNVERKVSAKWIVRACNAGLIEPDATSGFYKIVRPVEEGKETKPITKRYKKLTTEERDQLKEKIPELMSRFPLKPWRTAHIAESLGISTNVTSRLLKQLVGSGKIIHNAGEQTCYSLKVNEPEAEAKPNMRQEELTSLI